MEKKCKLLDKHKKCEKYKKDFDVIENSMMSLSVILKKRGGFSAKLEEDFYTFCEKMREIFHANPREFALKKVYATLPKNEWVFVYKRHSKHLL